MTSRPGVGVRVLLVGWGGGGGGISDLVGLQAGLWSSRLGSLGPGSVLTTGVIGREFPLLGWDVMIDKVFHPGVERVQLPRRGWARDGSW